MLIFDSSYLKESPFSLSTSSQNADEQPSLVIVYFGGNDSIHPHASGLGPHVPLEEYIENMRKIILHLKVEFYAITFIFFFFLLSYVYTNNVLLILMVLVSESV